MSFESAYGWIWPSPYEETGLFPATPTGVMVTVSDGNTDASVIYATIINKAQKNLRGIEVQTQYTPAGVASATASGEARAQTTCLMKKQTVTAGYPTRSPGLFLSNARLTLPFTFPEAVQDFFGDIRRSPFGDPYGMLCSAIGYNNQSATRTYFACTAGINITGPLSLNVNVVKTPAATAADVFLYGDTIEATVLLFNRRY